MKKSPGKNFKRKPRIGDLVEFDITWCEGLNAGGNIWADKEKMFQYGVVTSIDSREAAPGSSLERTWDRYYIMWKGHSLMFFGDEKHIATVGEEQ